jgi:hypothetical protein
MYMYIVCRTGSPNFNKDLYQKGNRDSFTENEKVIGAIVHKATGRKYQHD